MTVNKVFFKYRDINKFDSLSLKLKYSFLFEFCIDLDKLSKSSKGKDKKEKINVSDTTSEFYNDLLKIKSIRAQI